MEHVIMESLDKEEVNAVFLHLCRKCLLKDPSEVKRDLGLGKSQDVTGKLMMELIKKHKLEFELKISWPKVMRTELERVEDRALKMPDLNETLKEPAFMKEIAQQKEDIKDPELKALDTGIIKVNQNPSAPSSPPPLPSINL